MVAGKSTEFLEEHEPRSVWISRLSGRESIIIGLWGMAFSIAGIGLGVLHSWWVKSEFLWAFLGLMFGLSAVSGLLVFTFSKSLKESIAATPALSYRSDLRFGIFSGFGLGVGFGGIFGVMMTWAATAAWSLVENPVVTEFEAGFSIGPGFGIGATLGSGILLGIWARPSWRVRLSGAIMGVRDKKRFRPIQFLEMAREGQILRQVGSVYQFRHAELQDHLVSRVAATESV